MEVLKFNITSPFSFFKKNEARAGFDLTYSHIHKNTIKGIVGAVIGLEGYNVHNIKKRMHLTEDEFPEFYTKLEKLKVSIVPITDNGDFEKFNETFTETQGMFGASGANLIVREQQIVRGEWEIYLELDELDEEVRKKIKDYFLNRKAEYLPYLGKNEHFANIYNVELINVEKQPLSEVKVHSLFLKEENEEIDYDPDELDDDEERPTYYLEELMPILLDENTGRYVLELVVFTDTVVERSTYKTESGKNLIFL